MSADILNSSLATMERHIQRLENDIQNFPKTDDQQDKFVEKMMISFFFLMVVNYTLCLKKKSVCVQADEGIVCAFRGTAGANKCAVLPGSGKQFKSLGLMGGTQGNEGNGSGCLATRC